MSSSETLKCLAKPPVLFSQSNDLRNFGSIGKCLSLPELPGFVGVDHHGVGDDRRRAENES